VTVTPEGAGEEPAPTVSSFLQTLDSIVAGEVLTTSDLAAAIDHVSLSEFELNSPLRVGSKLGRTLYLQLGQPEDDVFVGTMDTPRLAEEVVKRWNAALGPDAGTWHSGGPAEWQRS
jgi:hypothetical protein